MGSSIVKCAILLYLTGFLINVCAKKTKDDEKPTWAKKDIRDYSDADMERLLDQWDVSTQTTSIILSLFYYIINGRT